jgi:hypothetical protein|tara:strand:+ start:3637 stop:3837 length:201 start_codon:yes stop_codon:yes gene_type:complete
LQVITQAVFCSQEMPLPPIGDKFRSIEQGMSSPQGVEAQTKLIEDEARFIDFCQSRVFMTEEHQIF